jgi:hypothetical protein
MSKLAAATPDTIDAIVNKFNIQAFEDLFPKGLDSAVASWIRMGAPIGEAEFHGFLKLGPTKHTHSRKGFQSAMATLLYVRNKQNIKLTEKQEILMNAHISEIPTLLMLIFDLKEKRQVIQTPRVHSGQVNIIVALLDQQTTEWLGRAWPKVTIQAAKPAESSQSGEAGGSKSNF